MKTIGRIDGIVLAAGTSTRFGRTKQLVELEDRPLIQHSIDGLAAVRGIGDVMIVVGHEADRVIEAIRLPRAARIIRNDRFEEGLATSLSAALAAATSEVAAVVVVLADQPRLPSGAAARIIDAWCDGRPPAHAVRATYGGMPGHPVLLARRLWPELRTLAGDIGARALLDDLGDRLLEVEMGVPSPPDLDTLADLQRLLRSDRELT